MIPISDENPTLRTPVMTWLILGAMFAVWLTVEGAGLAWRPFLSSLCEFGMVPAEVIHLAGAGGAGIRGGWSCAAQNGLTPLLTPITSMFLHGSWGHILSNALFLWVFGTNVEDSMGPGRFLAFYLVCGVVAAAAHIAVDPASTVPTVGASGAISGVLGGYLMLYPRVRVNMLFIFVIFLRVLAIPAWAVLLWWFFVQVLAGLPQLSQVGAEVSSGGVAVWAHVGGFLAGMALIRAFVNPQLVAQRNALRVQGGV